MRCTNDKVKMITYNYHHLMIKDTYRILVEQFQSIFRLDHQKAIHEGIDVKKNIWQGSQIKEYDVFLLFFPLLSKYHRNI